MSEPSNSGLFRPSSGHVRIGMLIVVPGANVVIIGTMYGSLTDTLGLYRINYVRVGVYDVR